MLRRGRKAHSGRLAECLRSMLALRQVSCDRRTDCPPNALRPHRPLPNGPKTAGALVGGNGSPIQMWGTGRWCGSAERSPLPMPRGFDFHPPPFAPYRLCRTGAQLCFVLSVPDYPQEAFALARSRASRRRSRLSRRRFARSGGCRSGGTGAAVDTHPVVLSMEVS